MHCKRRTSIPSEFCMHISQAHFAGTEVHIGSNISALNQSKEGCDWNSCHIISSFHDDGMISPMLSLVLVVPPAASPRGEVTSKFRVGGIIALGKSNRTADVWNGSSLLATGTRGLQRPSSVAHRRWRRLTYLFSVMRVEIPSVTACRS